VVMVTHHVEEIGPWIGYVLVLRNGRVLAAGQKHEVLTGPVLSDAFACPCEVESEDERYRLRVVGAYRPAID
jgi:iron complex transport system ATP-binding protein